jgi:predicted molibdopterin-dependent oxidoreductase YjgC
VRNARAAFGVLPPAPTYDAIDEAKILVVVDSALTETNPIMGNKLLGAVRNRGAKVVLLSSRGSKLSRHADLHILHNPGSAGAVLAAAASALVKKGKFDADAKEREGFDEFKKGLKDFTPASVAKACGADKKAVEELARRLGAEGPSLFLLSLPSYENVKGSATWAAAYNLSVLAGATTTGRLGVLTATEACNLQGALDMGVAPEYLPGFLRWEDKDAREAVGETWGKPLPTQPGLSAWEMIEEAEAGKLKGLVVFGANPLFDFPDALRVEAALKKLTFLAVVDPYLTETGALAHVVLPASTFAEKDGTFTNAEMRIQRVNAAIPPVAGARTDWKIIADLGKRFDMPGEYESVADIASEIAAVYPGFKGIEDPERTGGDGFLWREGAAKNTAPVFLAEPALEKPKPPAKGALTLVTGALLNHSGTVTRHCPGLNRVRGEAELRIHPEDAKDLEDGDEALLQAGGGAVTAKVRLDPTLARGGLFLPVHFESAKTQVLATVPDERGEREPTVVTLEKVKAKVGAGA